MPSIALVAPGPLEAPTGGSIYNRRIAEGLRRLGWLVDVLELDPSFPYPTPAAFEHADRAIAAVRAGTIAVVDSLALGAIPDLITREASRRPVVALVHLPLSAAIGLDRRTAARFEDGERRALAAAARVIVTGKAAIPLVATYGVDPGRVVVVEPGTDRAPLAHGSRRNQPDTAAPMHRTCPIELLTVATLNPGKGHEMLITALSAATRDHGAQRAQDSLEEPRGGPVWRLTCAGSLTRHPATVHRVRATVARLRLEDRVSLVGDLESPALAACYDRADVFVLATQQETYGMAVAEALAHGLPVVATMTGAIPELVGDDAGLLVPVGDAAGFTEALARVLGDAGLRARLAEGARRRRAQLPTWDEACRRMAAALHALCGVNACG